jgi:hypothetical protein
MTFINVKEMKGRVSVYEILKKLSHHVPSSGSSTHDEIKDCLARSVTESGADRVSRYIITHRPEDPIWDEVHEKVPNIDNFTTVIGAIEQVECKRIAQPKIQNLTGFKRYLDYEDEKAIIQGMINALLTPKAAKESRFPSQSGTT